MEFMAIHVSAHTHILTKICVIGKDWVFTALFSLVGQWVSRSLILRLDEEHARGDARSMMD